VCIGDRERIATIAVARHKVAPEVTAPELVRRSDHRERLRIRRRPPLLALGVRQTSTAEYLPHRARGGPKHVRVHAFQSCLELLLPMKETASAKPGLRSRSQPALHESSHATCALDRAGLPDRPRRNA
jgi:hypothetical protein